MGRSIIIPYHSGKSRKTLVVGSLPSISKMGKLVRPDYTGVVTSVMVSELSKQYMVIDQLWSHVCI